MMHPYGEFLTRFDKAHATNRRFHSVEVAERIIGDTRC